MKQRTTIPTLLLLIASALMTLSAFGATTTTTYAPFGSMRVFTNYVDMVTHADPLHAERIVMIIGGTNANDGYGGAFIATNTAVSTNLSTRIKDQFPGRVGYSWDRLSWLQATLIANDGMTTGFVPYWDGAGLANSVIKSLDTGTIQEAIIHGSGTTTMRLYFVNGSETAFISSGGGSGLMFFSPSASAVTGNYISADGRFYIDRSTVGSAPLTNWTGLYLRTSAAQSAVEKQSPGVTWSVNATNTTGGSEKQFEYFSAVRTLDLNSGVPYWMIGATSNLTSWRTLLKLPFDSVFPDDSSYVFDGTGHWSLKSTVISDTAYDATSWNGVTAISPSKNAVRDEIETLVTSIATKQTAFTTGAGATNVANVVSANLAAGSNVTFTTNSNGQISIASSGSGGSGTTYFSGSPVTNANFGSQFTATSTNVNLSTSLLTTNNEAVANQVYLGTGTNVVIDPLISAYAWAPSANCRFQLGTNSLSDTNKQYVIHVAIQAIASQQVTNVVDTWTSDGNWGALVSGLNELTLIWKAGALHISQDTAQIDATQIGGGAVSNTEFGYLDGVTSAIQTQLDAKQFGPLTGDVTTSGSVATLAPAGATAATYGDATHVPRVSIDSKGRITGVIEVPITGGGGSALDIDSYSTSTNATTNAVWTYTLPAGMSGEVLLTATGVGPTNYFFGHRLSASFMRNGSGAPTLLDISRDYFRSNTNIDAAFAVSGNDMVLVGNALTNETFNWHLKGVLNLVTNWVSGGGGSSPVYVSSASAVSSAAVSTLASSSITVSGSGAMLIVCVGEYGSTISGVATSNGQNLTKLDGIDNFDAGGKSEIWYLASPTAGAQTVTATFGGVVTESAIAVMLCNNVTTITAGATTGGNSTAQTSFSASVTSASGDLAGSGVVYLRPLQTFTPTGTGHTLRVQANNVTPKTSAMLSTMPGAGGSTALGWTVSPSSSEVAELTFNLH